MTTAPIRLHIAEVLTAVPSQVGVDAGLVLLTENDEPFRSLRIIIGQPEANAIYSAWHGNISSRPSTWDLFVSTVVLMGGRIDRIVITAVHEERHYFAHVEIEQAGERRTLACRPSDGLAIAVRAYNTEILAEPQVLDVAGVLPDGTKPVAKAAADLEQGAPDPEPAPSDPDLAEREAALAAREAELAERERQLFARESALPTSGDPALDSTPDDAEPAPLPSGDAGSEEFPKV